MAHQDTSIDLIAVTKKEALPVQLEGDLYRPRFSEEACVWFEWIHSAEGRPEEGCPFWSETGSDSPVAILSGAVKQTVDPGRIMLYLAPSFEGRALVDGQGHYVQEFSLVPGRTYYAFEIKSDYIIASRPCEIRDTLETAESVDLFRGLRDELMFRNMFGILLTTFYYRHTEELAHILAENDLLKDRLRSLLFKHQETARDLLEYKTAVISENDLSELVRFLEGIYSEAGMYMRTDIDFVLHGINTTTLLQGLGVTVE